MSIGSSLSELHLDEAVEVIREGIGNTIREVVDSGKILTMTTFILLEASPNASNDLSGLVQIVNRKTSEQSEPHLMMRSCYQRSVP